MTDTHHSTEPFDLVSMPDAASGDLRDQLASYAYVAGLASEKTQVIIPSREWSALCRETLDLVQQLLLLRRALIVLMQSTRTEALALPYTDLALASLVPLRVKHDPEALPNLLQLLLPGEGLVTVGSAAYNEPLTADDPEVRRLREACERALEALEGNAAMDTTAQLLRVTLRR